MKPKVVLTQTYQVEAIDRLQEEFNLIIVEGSGKSLAEVLKGKNVVLAPHTGSATYKARPGMAQMTIDNVKQALSGRIPRNLVQECKDRDRDE